MSGRRAKRNRRASSPKRMPAVEKSSVKHVFSRLRSAWRTSSIAVVALGVLGCGVWYACQGIYEERFRPLVISPSEAVLRDANDEVFFTVCNRSKRSVRSIELDLNLEDSSILSDDIVTRLRHSSSLDFTDPGETKTGGFWIHGNLNTGTGSITIEPLLSDPDYYRVRKKHAYPGIHELEPGEYAKIRVQLKREAAERLTRPCNITASFITFKVL
jgi:hypothetical protein